MGTRSPRVGERHRPAYLGSFIGGKEGSGGRGERKIVQGQERECVRKRQTERCRERRGRKRSKQRSAF